MRVISAQCALKNAIFSLFRPAPVTCACGTPLELDQAAGGRCPACEPDTMPDDAEPPRATIIGYREESAIEAYNLINCVLTKCRPVLHPDIVATLEEAAECARLAAELRNP